MAWYRNTEWIASRTRSLPRKANDTLDTPPEVGEPGNACFSRRTASMNETA